MEGDAKMVMEKREEIEIERTREERVEKKEGILTGKLCLEESGGN